MLKPVCITLLAAAASQPAFAHAGSHHSFNIVEAMTHYFSEPLHGGLIVAAGAAVVALRVYVKSRTR